MWRSHSVHVKEPGANDPDLDAKDHIERAAHCAAGELVPLINAQPDQGIAGILGPYAVTCEAVGSNREDGGGLAKRDKDKGEGRVRVMRKWGRVMTKWMV